jgi:HK97 gp10 family phage protein
MTGLKDLSAALHRAAEAAIEESARAACEQARALAPVDTGRLRDSIRAEADGLSAKVITDCEYASAVEFGTSRRAPQPFMRG